MSKEAMKLALEALEPFITPNWAGCGVDKANAAYADLCKALASEASEESSGVAQPDRHELQKDGKHPAPCARFCEAVAFNIEIRGLRKRLTEQPAQRKPWVGLTDKEIDKLVGEFRDAPVTLTFAIETKLKEKNSD